jgi:metal-responsive CopG/Arc/MetJ family transcriptional regulator
VTAKSPEPQKPFGVSLTERELAELTDAAEEQSMSRSALARAIIQHWLLNQTSLNTGTEHA